MSVGDGGGGVVLHGVKGDLLGLVHQSVIHDQVDLLGGVVEYGEEVDSALLGAEHGLHDFDLAAAEVAGADLEVLGEALHVDGGVVRGNHQVARLLPLLVLQEEVLREDHLPRKSPLELHLLQHLGDGEDWVVARGRELDPLGGKEGLRRDDVC